MMSEDSEFSPVLPVVALQAAPSSTGDMVERVARALLATAHKPKAILSPMMGDMNAWENLLPSERRFFLDAARAALEAIREPTEAQYEALSATGLMWRDLDSKTVWRTYIDAALSPLPEPPK